MFPLPKLQCHRGYWVDGIQENSLESVLEARRQGHQMVEFDVQVTADGIPVLFHDYDILIGKKKKLQLRRLKFAELVKIIPVSRLIDVLSHPQATDFFNIEIKSKMYLNKKNIISILDVIREARVQERILISSFNPWCLYYLKVNFPEIIQALLVSEMTWKFFSRKNIFTFLIKPHFLHIDQKLVTPEFLSEVQSRDIPLAVWTVNQQQVAHSLLSNGARSIITDKLIPSQF